MLLQIAGNIDNSNGFERAFLKKVVESKQLYLGNAHFTVKYRPLTEHLP